MMTVNQKINTKFTVGSFIREKLIHNEDIMNLLDNKEKIYPIIAPEGTKGDYIVYVRDKYSLEKTKMGIYSQECIVYVSCISPSYDKSSKLAESVFQCLHGIKNETSADNLIINSIEMIDSIEDYAANVYIQTLEFLIK